MKLKCQHCQDRYPACSDYCEHYKAWKTEQNLIKNMRKHTDADVFLIHHGRRLSAGSTRTASRFRKNVVPGKYD